MTTISSMPSPVTHVANDRPRRRAPFSNWVKRLTHFKSSSSSATLNPNTQVSRLSSYQMKKQSKKIDRKSNNPYMCAVQRVNSSINPDTAAHSAFSVPIGTQQSRSTIERSRLSSDHDFDHDHNHDHDVNTLPPRSVAPTVSTTADHELATSDIAGSHAASSGAGTMATMGPTSRGIDSTFSSPAPSVRSLATTLTTIQSANANTGLAHNIDHNSLTPNTPFVHQYPTSPHPTAIPSHLAPTSGGHPTTYNMVTANNMLTDNASILTLASSSKRRRRRSMDTDASVRAMAPSSLFGGSRESLPLSLLSVNHESNPLTSGISRQSIGGAAERASIYSATGVAPALSSDRNSLYATRTLGDAVSVKSGKSGMFGHGRAESVSGSAGVLGSTMPSSPLAPLSMVSTREMAMPNGRLSRKNSTFEETPEGEEYFEAEGGSLAGR